MNEYTVEEVAASCKLSTSMIYRAITAGQLQATEKTDATDKRDRWTITEEAMIAYKRWRVTKHGDYYPELDQAQ
jgi:hypothetical protein